MTDNHWSSGKTTCTAPYRLGYSYSRQIGLICRECGRPDYEHETLREQVERDD